MCTVVIQFLKSNPSIDLMNVIRYLVVIRAPFNIATNLQQPLSFSLYACPPLEHLETCTLGQTF